MVDGMQLESGLEKKTDFQSAGRLAKEGAAGRGVGGGDIFTWVPSLFL